LDNEIGVFFYGFWRLDQIILITGQLASIPGDVFIRFFAGFGFLGSGLFEISLVVDLGLTVHEGGVITLLGGQIFFELFSLPNEVLVDLSLHLLARPGYENAAALTPRLRLTNKHHWWMHLRFLLRHILRRYLFCSCSLLLLAILLNIVKVGRVQPCVREEVVVVRKGFLEAF